MTRDVLPPPPLAWAQPRVYSDAYLNHWADVFLDRNVREYGVELESFLLAPQRVLAWIDTCKPMRVGKCLAPAANRTH